MKVNFLIDGFNLYHSIVELDKKNNVKCKWLNLKLLFTSFLPLIDRESELGEIFFFTAIRTHVQELNPETVQRHKLYMKVLKNLDVKIIYGRFKRKNVFCKLCRREFAKYEEKETDVGIACKLFELGSTKSNEIMVIVSGDTDLAPAIRTYKTIYPNSKIFVIFPPYRINDELKNIGDGHFKLKQGKLISNLLQNEYVLQDQSIINKPDDW